MEMEITHINIYTKIYHLTFRNTNFKHVNSLWAPDITYINVTWLIIGSYDDLLYECEHLQHYTALHQNSETFPTLYRKIISDNLKSVFPNV